VNSIFKIGDSKIFIHKVEAKDTATFESGEVHPVYATFAIARDAEWSSRLFVLDMKDENEEGIGTFVEVKHHAPAFIGEEVLFEATVDELTHNAINCSIKASVGNRLIATGRTGQKVLSKIKLEQHFQTIKNTKF
jgi:fluoroacetyl-CoA thioesterase